MRKNVSLFFFVVFRRDTSPLCVNSRITPRIIMNEEIGQVKENKKKIERNNGGKQGEGHYYKRDNEGVRKWEARSDYAKVVRSDRISVFSRKFPKFCCMKGVETYASGWSFFLVCNFVIEWTSRYKDSEFQFFNRHYKL